MCNALRLLIEQKGGETMPTFTVRSRWSACGITIALHSLLGACAIAADAPKGSPIPPSPAFTPPPLTAAKADIRTGKPIATMKKLAKTNPLLRPPFAAAPVDSLKGMASGIKAVELDAPNRILAVQYLSTVDCATYPQAQEMLIQTMQEDPIEEVRYEAVMALRAMLSHGCCNLETQCQCESCCQRQRIAAETKKHAKKSKYEHEKPKVLDPYIKMTKNLIKATPKERRYDCCRGCCNEKVLNALSKVAYEKDDQCCWGEPSERVRQAAAEGLCLCTTSPAPYGEPMQIPDVPVPDGKLKEVGPPDDKEVPPPQAKEASLGLRPPAPAILGTTSATPLRGSIRPGVTNNASLPIAGITRQVSAAKPVTSGQQPVIAGLNGFCVVALKERQFVPTNVAFSSTFEDHTYFFSSAETKATFDRNPESYAPAYGGFDPVVFLEKRQLVEGQFLREFEGRFYLFASKENWETFKSTPQRFVLRDRAAPRSVVAR